MPELDFHPVVDPEFAALIPPLASDESSQLEANLVAHGCRDPLVVWEETGVLLDGHNRLRICQAHGLPFATAAVSLPDRDAAEDWMDANQLGRRNLSPDQQSLLRGRRYNRAKKRGAPVFPFVYFVEGAGLIKVGVSENPEERLTTLQCGSPVPLTLLTFCTGGYEMEAFIHECFSGDRVHGEWFRRSPHLDEIIERHRKEGAWIDGPRLANNCIQ